MVLKYLVEEHLNVSSLRNLGVFSVLVSHPDASCMSRVLKSRLFGHVPAASS